MYIIIIWGETAMKNIKARKKHETLRLFCKSASITALCIALICALAAGMLAADKNTKAASGNMGGLELRDIDDRSLSFELLGTIYSFDLKPIFSAVNKLESCYDMISPERRLGIFAVQKGFSVLDSFFDKSG